jgi:hypothetical protein
VKLEEGALTVIHIRNVILEHLLRLDEHMEELDCHHAFIVSRDDDYSDVSVYLSGSLVACEYHQFMMEASISIPRFGDAGDEEPTMECLFHWVFVLLTQEMRVVWMTKRMCDNNALRESDHSLVSFRSPSESRTKGTTRIAGASAYLPSVFDIDIGRNLADNKSLTEMKGYLLAHNMIISDG